MLQLLMIIQCFWLQREREIQPYSSGQDRKILQTILVEAKCRIRSHPASTADQRKNAPTKKFYPVQAWASIVSLFLLITCVHRLLWIIPCSTHRRSCQRVPWDTSVKCALKPTNAVLLADWVDASFSKRAHLLEGQCALHPHRDHHRWLGCSSIKWSIAPLLMCFDTIMRVLGDQLIESTSWTITMNGHCHCYDRSCVSQQPRSSIFRVSVILSPGPSTISCGVTFLKRDDSRLAGPRRLYLIHMHKHQERE